MRKAIIVMLLMACLPGAVAAAGSRFAGVCANGDQSVPLGAKPMLVNAAAAEIVVVGRVTEVLPARPYRVALDDGPAQADNWQPIKVEVSEVLLDWAAAATKPAGVAGKPWVIDVTVAPTLAVNPAKDAKPLAPRSGIAPSELNRATRYVFFLNRIPEVQSYVLLTATACYLADDQSIADARASVRFDTWNWGKAAGPLRVCYVPMGKPEFEMAPGKSVGGCWISGWTILRNTGPAAVEVTVGSPRGPQAEEVPVTLEATLPGGAAASAVVLGPSTIRIPPGHCAFPKPPQNALAQAWTAGRIDTAPGELTVQARVPLSRVNGKPPAAGGDVLLSAPLKMTAAARRARPGPDKAVQAPPERALNARRIVFVCHVKDAANLATVRTQLSAAVGGIDPTRSFDIIFVADGQPQVLAEKAMLVGTPANQGAAAAFLEKTAATKSADPLPALKMAFWLGPELVFFLTDSPIADKSLPAAVAKLNVGHKVKVNTILYGTIDEATRDALIRVAEESGGTFKQLEEKDLKP